MTKRDIFSELKQSMQEFIDHDSGKITLKTHTVTNTPLSITSQEIEAIRYKLNLSQAVFATYLHTEVKTLRNWEQGITKPNKQAILLIKMVSKNPNMLHELLAAS